VKHFGFSKLYRLNNGHHIGDFEPLKKYIYPKINEYDLAQLIFGTINNDSESLKGRVFISHAFCEDSNIETSEQTRVLSSPRPSYYPNYLSQTANNNGNVANYKTYINNDSALRGYKRYPVHNNTKPNISTGNENIPSIFHTLPKNTSFKCKIRFHNLKKIELGALISAITFHNHSECFHTLGGGKPYGFGKVSITLNKFEDTQLDCLADFEFEMDKHIKKINPNDPKWINSPAIRELISMAKNPSSSVNNNLVYPKLEVPNVLPKYANEFINQKNDGEYLESYSTYNTQIKLNSYKRKIKQKIEIPDFNLDGLVNFKSIQNKIRDEYFNTIPDNKVDYFIEKMKEVYANDKESRKNINKPYEDYFAKTPISIWLGESEAKALYEKLTNPKP
jgi:hypothetical protein